MNFAAPRPRRGTQDRAIVPMINIVFLLLIFFLMTASLTPPPPFALDPALAAGTPGDRGPDTLYIAGDGRMAFGDARGDAVFAAIGPRDTLAIQADATLAAADLAALLPRLSQIGVRDVRLITVQP
ncbi:Biopolymer transport protein ExbD/TolR [Roseibacterium elongatum DSM 19469]|uniref:Biopolymer transport protein ExbD/TolR n=1 Tax=Roseicyclus elongatus DSM 19469 TaxID=1294273 RepID=W8RQT8_9RHOB|nr:biopolymer transporter ExbD [Roseibacterium elongatum]AHM03408.1 Biopolymer transport protein ExbD/TolR [Roseibacterium elongatum DSM 19469]